MASIVLSVLFAAAAIAEPAPAAKPSPAQTAAPTANPTLSSPQPAANALAGGPFQLEPSVIASGGGEVSGGAFTLNGTIGQAAAGGAMAGGTFAVSSGFWQSVSGSGSTTGKRRPGQITSQ